MFVRGELHFKWVSGDIIEVWLGKPHLPESEFILSISKYYLKDLVAGLTHAKNN